MSFDNGLAPSVQSANIDEAKVPRSSFNMSRVINTNGIIGALIPFDLMETLPNEDYNISYDILALTRNPLVRRLQNGFTMYVHTYYCKKKDLWKGFKNYYDKGRSRQHVSSVPKYYPACDANGNTTTTEQGIVVPKDHSTTDYSFLTPFSPACYMGVPATAYDDDEPNVNTWFKPAKSKADKSNLINNGYNNVDNQTKWALNALPLVMYNKIYRDYYANENILSKNSEWYHDNDDEDLILPYDCEEWVNTANGELVNYNVTNVLDGKSVKDANSEYYIPKGYEPGETTTESAKKPLLNMLHFRQFKGDYFTTANIFKDLLRGTAPSVDLGQIELDQTEPMRYLDDSEYMSENFNLNVGIGADPSYAWLTTQGMSSHRENIHEALKTIIKNMNLRVGSNGGVLNNIRKAMVLEKIMQRNATTSGTYRELVGANFGYYPDDPSRRPTYIGGTYQPIVFNEVVQTSASQTGSPLGTTGSRGMSAETGYIGKFHSDDFGYIMSILSIVPDTYYNTQSIEPLWNRTEQDMEYMPILNNLEPEPVLNKELYISGDAEYDNDVWGYVNRFENMKSRRNIISGLGALGERALYDSSSFMKRTFANDNKPTLSQSFLTMSIQNIDMTPFTSKNEPPFDLMIGCNIDKVSPMPYKAEPCDMGIKY